MTYGLVRTLALVTLGSGLAGHALVRWARRKGDAGDTGASLAIACGIVAAGLALQGNDDVSAGVLFGALALIVAGLLAVARRRSGRVSG